MQIQTLLRCVSARRVCRWSLMASLSAFAVTASYDFSAAQTAGQDSTTQLPPVNVPAPVKRTQAPRAGQQSNAANAAARARRARAANAAARAAAAASAVSNVPPRETGRGPVEGIVAHESTTGTKTDTPIIETPQSISVVPKDQIEAQQVSTAKEALRYSAGADADTRGNFGLYDIIYSRGFPAQRYLDGMRLQGDAGFVTPQVDLWGVERVELLRGPASILYGQGQPGGIVNIVSKMPMATPGGEVELVGGSWDHFQGAFDVGGPIDKQGQFEYRINGLFMDSNNQVDYAKQQRTMIAPSFTWHPDADTSFTVLLSYQHDPWGGYYNFVPSVGSLLPNPNGKISTNFYSGDPSYNQIDRVQYSGGYLFERRLSDVFTVRQNLRYLDTTGDLNQVLPFNGGLEADDATLDRYAQADHERIGAFTLDNQLQAKFATAAIQHTAFFGLDYQNTLYNQNLLQTAPEPSINVFNPVYYQPIVVPTLANAAVISLTDQLSTQTGVYGQDQMKIGNLVVVGGARHDWADSHTTVATFGTGTDSDTTQQDEATTGRIGAVYLFDNGIAPYAVYAQSFNPNLGTEFDGTPFKPTTGTLYEAGARYVPPGFNAMLTASVFDLTEQNVLTPDPVNAGFDVETGEIRSRGVEFEGKASITKQLSLIATYTHDEVENTQTNEAGALGKVPVQVPENMASFWGDYTFRNGPMNGFGFGGGIRYIGHTYGDDANTELVPAYTLVDAALHYDFSHFGPQWKGYELQVNATNLFDKVYVAECNTANCVYGLRRTVLATLRYRW
jgi:iron complex outermembrane recepter protein